VLGLALTATLVMLCRQDSPADVAPSDLARPASSPLPVARQAHMPDERRPASDASSGGSGREAVVLPPTTTDTWCVQLVGIDPTVSGTSPLVLEFERSLVVEAAVDALGACRSEPPDAVREPGIQMLRFFADDTNDPLERSHNRTDELQTNGRMELRVHPTTVLRGHVLGPDGEGVEARVRAFPWNGVAGGVWRVPSLLPVQHAVDVPVDGAATTVEAEFGGTIQLDVLDANGMRVDGRFTLCDPAGRDVTASMLAHETDVAGSGVRVGAPGELHAPGPNLLATPLPPGDDTLKIDPRGHRRMVRRVTVAAHAGATVKVLLD
jgi:hypothetical protein